MTQSQSHRVIACVGAFAALAMAGCSGSNAGGSSSSASASQDKPSEITLLTQMTKGTGMGNIQDAAIAEFQQKTGITVKVSEAAGDATIQSYEAAVLAGNEPDIINIAPTGKVQDWVTNNAVADAEPYLSQWGLDKIISKPAIDAYRDKNGKLLAVPYAGFVWPMVWNTAQLKKAGIDKVPTTADELQADIAKAKAANVGLVAAGGNDWSGQKFALLVFQAYTSNDEMKQAYTSGKYCSNQNIMKGIDYFVKLRDAGMFLPNTEGFTVEQQNKAYMNATAAGMFSGTWAMGDIPAAVQATSESAGFPVPSDSQNKKPLYYAGYASQGFMISPNGAKKSQWVGEFLKLFYEKAQADQITKASAVPDFTLDTPPTVTNPALKSALSVKDSAQEALLMDSYVPGSVQSAMTGAVSQAFVSGKTAQQVCQAIEASYK